MTSQRVSKLGIAACLWFFVGAHAAAAADCGPKLEAEFQKLRTLGRAYRIETVVFGERQGPTQIFEFVPPDRMRLKYRFKQGADWAEFVRVGDRVWDHEKELPAALADVFAQQAERLGQPLGTFECLGLVRFSGKTYTGYRTYRLEYLVSAVQPAERRAYWRTVLVDRGTGALAHEIATLQKKLDNPKWQKRYTYPNDIAIYPPKQ
jgi:hypothetical protein